MANRFYTSFALAPGMVILQGPEAHHLATVRRFDIGETVILFNGDGNEYPAEIVSVNRKAVVLHVLQVDRINRELPIQLIIACALPKGDRADFLIEKLTELGVTEFIPVQTERSVVKPGEAKLDRLSRAAIEASKQCGRNQLLRIQPLTPWTQLCRRSEIALKRFIADPHARQPVEPCRDESVCIAVGPEGGLTEAEIEEGREAGWET